MINDFRKHFIKNPPPFRLTPEYAEKIEVESLGGTHSKVKDGPDGHWPNGMVLFEQYHDTIEIKTQIFQTDSDAEKIDKLYGKATYSNPSKLIHKEKLDKDEFTVVLGCDIEGEVYYRYSYNFSAIEADYLNRVDYLWNTERKHGSNFILTPVEYFKDKARGVEKFQSFQMHWIHPDIKNMAFTENGIQRIQDKWFYFLCNYPKEEIVPLVKGNDI